MLLLAALTASAAAQSPHSVPPLETPTVKGLQCIVDMDDALSLGIHHAAINLRLDLLLDATPTPDSPLHFTAGEQSFGINISYLASIDDQVRRLTQSGVRVYFIILNGLPPERRPDHPLVHPATNLAAAPNGLGAFNTVDEAGRTACTQLMSFLADRYSRDGDPHGRCTDFIIGNEVQSHWHWHNLGDATPELVIDDYARTLRLADEAVRSRNTAARVYISMDHFWARAHQPKHPHHTMPGRQLIDGLNERIKAEGDFPWQVAFHPYPENLFNPRTWNDATATRRFDTPRITFRNLEVLTAYLRQPHMLYEGRPRAVILSEQGFHAGDSPEDEMLQAAAFAYAWQRVSRIEGILAFILHRHIDHAREGGLRLGLRANQPGTITTPGDPRKIYEVFRAAGTADQQRAFEFALPIIGIDDWSELAPRAVEDQ